MDRIITVKGIGKVNAKPDLIVLSIHLEARHMEYDSTMNAATIALEQIQNAITTVGFKKEDLKTIDLEINPNFESQRDNNGNYNKIFLGYICTHRLKLEFDFEMKRLSRLFSILSKCSTKPEFSVMFSVKDKEAVSKALLINAVENAKAKAEILAEASGVKLGKIITIDYNWSEIQFNSLTRYNSIDQVQSCVEAPSLDIEPDDINVRDTITFVWEIQ